MRHFNKLLFASILLINLPASVLAQSMKLPDAIHDRVVQLTADADRQTEAGLYGDAAKTYAEAFDLLPEPKTDWSAFTSLLVAIGDANFKAKKYRHAVIAFSDSMYRVEATRDPYIHLRLGQSQFELGNLPMANEELARAYRIAGEEIFENEDPKYFAHLRTVLLPPVNGER